jgi:hypothetical protein
VKDLFNIWLGWNLVPHYFKYKESLMKWRANGRAHVISSTVTAKTEICFISALTSFDLLYFVSQQPSQTIYFFAVRSIHEGKKLLRESSLRGEHNTEMCFTKRDVRFCTRFRCPVTMSSCGSVRTRQKSGFHRTQLTFLSTWGTLCFLQGLDELLHRFPMHTKARFNKLYLYWEQSRYLPDSSRKAV